MVICRNENLIKRAAEVALNNLAERGDAAGEVGGKTKFCGILRNTALWTGSMSRFFFLTYFMTFLT